MLNKSIFRACRIPKQNCGGEALLGPATHYQNDVNHPLPLSLEAIKRRTQLYNAQAPSDLHDGLICLNVNAISS